MAVDADLKEMGKPVVIIMALQDSLSSLAEIVLQNRRNLLLLLSSRETMYKFG